MAGVYVRRCPASTGRTRRRAAILYHRAMAIRVECYAGYRGDQEPRVFWLGERRLEVLEIVDRWLGPDYRHFRVSASDGDTYILRHDGRDGEWELAAFRRGL
jgi:hypothetical protein